MRLEDAIRCIQRGFDDTHDLFRNKHRFKEYIARHDIRVPKTYSFINAYQEFDKFWNAQEPVTEFVVKPNGYANGTGIYAIKKDGDKLTELDGTPVTREQIKKIAADQLKFNLYRYRGLIMEELIHTHPSIKAIYGVDTGIADIRVVMLDDEVKFARLRTPCKKSRYYSNWTRGGQFFHVTPDGTIVDGRLIFENNSTSHPDTGKYIIGTEIPLWNVVVKTAIKVAKLFEIPFHTVDMTVDENGEAVVIEGETTPGMDTLTDYGRELMLKWIDERK